MTDVITKVAIGGVEYPFAGGGSSGEEHEFITQEEYEQLTPAQKAEKVYMITGEGSTGGGGSAEDTSYDNTTSGLTATNVQDAIDELAQGHGTTPGGDTDPMQTWISYVIATQPGNKKSIFVNNKDGSYNLDNIPAPTEDNVTLSNGWTASVRHNDSISEEYLYELTRGDYYTIFEKSLGVQKLNSQSNTKIMMWLKASDYETLTAGVYLPDGTSSTVPTDLPTTDDLVYCEQGGEKYFFKNPTRVDSTHFTFDVYKVNGATSTFVKTISGTSSTSIENQALIIYTVSDFFVIKSTYNTGSGDWLFSLIYGKVDVSTGNITDQNGYHGEYYRYSSYLNKYGATDKKYYFFKPANSRETDLQGLLEIDIDNKIATRTQNSTVNMIYNDYVVNIGTASLYHDYYNAIFDSQSNVEYVILQNDSKIATPTDKIVDIDIDGVVKTFYASDLQSKEFNTFNLIRYGLAVNPTNAYISVKQNNGLINTYATQNNSLSIKVKTYVDKIHINAGSSVNFLIY